MLTADRLISLSGYAEGRTDYLMDSSEDIHLSFEEYRALLSEVSYRRIAMALVKDELECGYYARATERVRAWE